jgi:predicted nucleotidyltransferase
MCVEYFELDLARVLEAVKRVLEGFEWVEVAVVFGSILRRSTVRDVDVGIIAVKPLTLEELNEIASKLEEALGVNVDVVPLDEAPPLLRFKALTEGVRVINRNPLRLHYMISEAFMELMDLRVASGNTAEGPQVTPHRLKTKIHSIS